MNNNLTDTIFDDNFYLDLEALSLCADFATLTVLFLVIHKPWISDLVYRQHGVIQICADINGINKSQTTP